MDFGCATTSGSSYSVFLGPPLPPHESWWARTIEPSTMMTSPSNSPAIEKSASHFPAFDHSLNLLNMVFHFPNLLGRSRHGDPVFAIQTTASMKLRSPFSDGGPDLLGRSRRSRFHCSFVRACRCIHVLDHNSRSPCKGPEKTPSSDRNDPAFPTNQGHPLVQMLIIKFFS